MNPIKPFVDRNGAFILDGGLATQLEARGEDLGDTLWSARLLLDDPALIGQVHADYLLAGADCIITASYQATIPGFMSRGLSEIEAKELLGFAVALAVEERDKYWSALAKGERARRIRPLVAASVGPYAAYRADGSEYTGNYDLGEADLVEFHRKRWFVLAESAADIMACETIPVFDEARALARLLTETPEWSAWFSFTCRDGQHIVDGTPIRECASFLSEFEQVAAIGVNCSPPHIIPSLIEELRKATDKLIVVYPNSGEVYDVQRHLWRGEAVPAEFGTYSREWRKLGAAAIGGCCRTTPAHVQQIRDRFPWKQSNPSR
ncbi:MAG: homocysteine S-methyltransferase [Anaerolineaceae bacterium]|nr:MAG: homocysteine S-methyltransferase [Anaerolineaceae bacterium]